MECSQIGLVVNNEQQNGNKRNGNNNVNVTTTKQH